MIANTSGSSCLGPLSGLKDPRFIYECAVKSLTDSRKTLLILVARAEEISLREAARASAEFFENRNEESTSYYKWLFSNQIKGSLSDEDMALLVEELRSPCIEEIAVFRAFAHAEATPVHEAARLQDDLRRAQIKPLAWIIKLSDLYLITLLILWGYGLRDNGAASNGQSL